MFGWWKTASVQQQGASVQQQGASGQQQGASGPQQGASGQQQGVEFDWGEIPEVNQEELLKFVGSTDMVERQFPLVLALQVHDEFEAALMSPKKLDGMQLAEIRGGLKALKRFCQIYKFRAVDENRKANVINYDEEE